MKALALLGVLLVALVGCGYDYDEIGFQCEQVINTKLRYEGKTVKSANELDDGIVTITYGYSGTAYGEKSLFCGVKGNNVIWNRDIVGLKSALGL